jgi:hypothetical protein
LVDLFISNLFFLSLGEKSLPESVSLFSYLSNSRHAKGEEGNDTMGGGGGGECWETPVPKNGSFNFGLASVYFSLIHRGMETEYETVL